MFIRIAAIAAAAVAAPVVLAAPAMAAPVTFGCAPCVGDINGDTKNDPVWNEVTSLLPWETTVAAVNGGFQEAFADSTDGVPGDGEGAWEKVFPPAG